MLGADSAFEGADTLKPSEKFPVVQTLLLWAMVITVLAAALPLGAARPVSWTLLAMIITALFAVQLLYDNINALPAQTKGLWLPALLFFGAVGWGFVQILPNLPTEYIHPAWANVSDVSGYISADPGEGRQVLMRYLCYMMIFWIAFRASFASMRAGLILKAFALFSAVLAIFGLYTLAAGTNPILSESAEVKVVTASFVNRNSYATYAAFGALANLAAYLHIASGTREDDNHWRSYIRDILERFFDGAWIYAVGFLACMGALSLTQSRAGGVAALVGLLVFLAAWRGKGRRWNPLMLLLIAAVLGFVVLTSATGMTNRILATGPENGRFLVYPEIVAAIQDRPLLGHGLGSFHDVFRQYVPAEAALGEWVRAHNSFLENAFELGLPAAAAFYLALALIVWRIRSGTIKRARNRAFSCFALAVVATGATHSLFDFSLQMPAIAAVFAVILGLGWAQSLPSASSRRSSRKTARTPEAKTAPTRPSSDLTEPLAK